MAIRTEKKIPVTAEMNIYRWLEYCKTVDWFQCEYYME